MYELKRLLKALLPMLPKRAVRYLRFFGIASAALSLLDTAAVAVIALVLSALVTGTTISLPVIGPLPDQARIWAIVAAAFLMVLKSALVLLLQYSATRRFAQFELEFGNELFQSYIHAPWVERLKRSSSEIARLSDVGIANVVNGVLLPAAQIPTHLLTFFSILAVVIITDPVTAGVTIFYLGIITVLLYRVMTKKSLQAGRVNRDYAIRMSNLITEMVNSLKEITLRDKTAEVATVVGNTRVKVAQSRSNIRFLGSVPKFISDLALVGGFALVGGLAWMRGGVDAAFLALAVFGIAGFKMIPPMTTLQTSLSSIQSNIPYSWTVVNDIKEAQQYRLEAERIGHDPLPSKPKRLDFKGVGFTYPGSVDQAVHDLNLEIPIGSSLGVAGPSGAGKSTLIDLLLGLLTPTEGAILLDGEPLIDHLAGWRQVVGYVPQDVTLFAGSVAQNVALTWGDDWDEDRVVQALKRAQLYDTIMERPGGLNSKLGERGLTLSGGQRQRLGMARALYSEPLVLVLDEATSALDSTTEDAVSEAINALHGEVTVISVAHRLSTIRNVDKLCFMSDGTIQSQGTFEEVVSDNDEFKEQARLAGLA
ncbi:MAG: ABC transporter ATP-binding protein [Brooklawnia sp.]|jgi:ABC-type multidrug transport system fused ATPase/permease subunit